MYFVDIPVVSVSPIKEPSCVDYLTSVVKNHFKSSDNGGNFELNINSKQNNESSSEQCSSNLNCSNDSKN